jgi:hypothetical protein
MLWFCWYDEWTYVVVNQGDSYVFLNCDCECACEKMWWNYMNIGQMNEDMVVTNCGDYACENEIDWVYM